MQCEQIAGSARSLITFVVTGLMPGSYQTILKAGLFRQFRFFVGIDRLQRFEVFAA